MNAGTEIRARLTKIDQSESSLKKFAALFSTAMLLVAFVAFCLRHFLWTTWLSILVLALLLLALFRPRAIKGFHRVWMGLALAMGWVMSRVLLTIFFYLVISPVGLLLRLLRKDLLNAKIEKEKASYWRKRKAQSRDIERYERQF